MRLLISVALCAFLLHGALPPQPVLTTAIEVHRLPGVSAEQGRPVLLRGVVTHVMPQWRGFSFQDATDALYVSAESPQTPALETGQAIEVRGYTHPGNFASMVMATQIRILGKGAMPKPRAADWKLISSGACDNDYIEVEGVVRSALVVDPPRWRWHATALHLDLGGNLLWAYLEKTDDRTRQRLPDATVRIKGVCVVLSNSRSQFEQNVLLADGPGDVQIIEPARADPFALPPTGIDRLFEYKPTPNGPHRVRVRGLVTLTEPGRVFLEDDGSGLVVRSVGPSSVKVGEVADAVGFPGAGNYSTVLEDALIRPTGAYGQTTPLGVKPSEVMTRWRDNRPALPDSMLVRMQATVLDMSRSAREEVVVLQDGSAVFTARLRVEPGSNDAPALQPAARVDLTGVCVIQVGDLGTARSFELLLRSPADIRVLKRAPWLTRSIALQIAEALLAVAGGTAVWVALLRRRVRAQTGVIRRQLERESALAERLQALVENASDMVYIRDLEGRLLHVNHGAEQVTGFTREELLRMNVIDLLAPEEREKAREQLAASARDPHQGTEEVEWRLLRKDGREITVEVKHRFITEGDGRMRVEAIGRDVTARTQAMLENQERFRTLADNIAQLAWMADESGFTFWYNQRWFDYTGSTLEEARGWGWQAWHHPDHVERVLERIRHSFETGERWEDTFPLRGRDGQYRWFLGRAMPILNQRGTVVRWFGTNTDITEQKQAETELQRSNEDLRQFAYVASHDLQEPLRNICVFSELLARSYSNGELSQERREYLEVLNGGARRMEALIRDLLAYSRASGAENPAAEEVDFELVFRTALQSLSASIGESAAKVTHDELPTIAASASQMSQVLQNLIGNSIKYRRAEVPLTVHVRAEHQTDSWLFSVRDNGRGFDPKYAENVFGIFRRLHGLEIPGTGIGLAICKTIVERHGGRIWAEAKPGEGATFYFTIPDGN